MKTTSVDLRERIVAVYDAGQSSREEVAKRFHVSLGLVKKLLSQRKRTGSIEARHCYSGRKPKITTEHRAALRELVQAKPDTTLEEMKQSLALECTLPAIHYVLISMNLTYKKRHSVLVNKSARISNRPGRSGKSGKASLMPPGSSSSTNQRPKQT